MRVSIFNYLDYQTFLSDWIKDAKSSDRRVSYQRLAQKAGISSKGYVHKVFTGKKTLSVGSYGKIAPLVTQKESEERYFKLLVQLKHIKDEKEIDTIMRSIEQLINPDVFTLELDTYNYFSQWYHPVIREMVCSKVFRGDFHKLGKMLSPPISVRDVQSSVKLLLKLQLIEENEEDGSYGQTNRRLRTDNNHVSQAVSNHIKKMIGMGERALHAFTPEERYIVTITAGVSHESYREIDAALKECREKIDTILNRNEPIETVCQCNMQYFPLANSTETQKVNV
ncbi:MAG: TIGR02147 family protein [Fibrobacterales bacterium]